MINEERLNQLEKRLTLLKRYNYLLWIVILVTWGGCMTFSGLNTMKTNAEVEEKDQKIITANGFKLVDEKGKMRGCWGISDFTTELCLFGDKGSCITLKIVDDKENPIPTLQIYDKKFNPRITLGITPGGPDLTFFDESSVPRVILGSYRYSSLLSLLDKNAEPRMQLWLERSKPAIYVKDEKGKVIWQAPEKKKEK